MNRSTVIAIPAEWAVKPDSPGLETYKDNILIPEAWSEKRKAEFIISNGRYITNINQQLLDNILKGFDDDIIMVNVDSELSAYRENARITSDGKVAGFSRQYSDAAVPAPFPDDWPHHIFIKKKAFKKIPNNRALSPVFADFMTQCKSNGLKLRSFRTGGSIADLYQSGGLLNFLLNNLHTYHPEESVPESGNILSPDARISGKVIMGLNVRMDQRSVIVGPAVIGDNVTIESDALIKRSVIGTGQSISKNGVVRNRLIIDSQSQKTEIGQPDATTDNQADLTLDNSDNFRKWSRFCYARSIKRIADVIASVTVLILFAPVLPVIALAVKFNSSGPVFYKAVRQGLHGKPFSCLKFRTMITGADLMQEKLRYKSQVDGPQFKMEQTDPRITAVGKFLRDTFLDEIPQFINIFLGQMSLVGPRPSPEEENTTCPYWRDARLSVRPGITGPWQLYRTRLPGRDFQEWIYYDTEYVRKLSLKTDIRICIGTVRKLVTNFMEQF
jgi:lipopolysaccharide/colanic/teichoic acid biosynthesis glycosyltransferase